jgi:biopolymer transport protein ExbD
VNIRTNDESEELALNLTPLIDVVFLLLIFFMVTTTFLDPEREIEVELPSAESGAEPQVAPEEITLIVLEDGSVIHLGSELGRDELIGLLRTTAQHDPQTPVTIRGHRLARHEAIVSVMDACGIAGLSNLAVGTSLEEKG